MSTFQPSKKFIGDFNGGEKFEPTSRLNYEDVNNIIESTLYAQDNVGTGGSGTGGAALTNYYGDSATDGYTQHFINGEAQAKNYYNLGAYDTCLYNSDGTVTITRKTGYIINNLADYVEDGTIYKDSRYEHMFYCSILSRYVNFYNGTEIKNNKYQYVEVTSLSELNNYDKAIARYGNHLIIIQDIDCTTQAEAEIKIPQNLIIQYELDRPYVEKCIKNVPLNNLDNNGQEWLYEERQKTLNLFDNALLSETLLSTTGNTNSYFTMDFMDDTNSRSNILTIVYTATQNKFKQATFTATHNITKFYFGIGGNVQDTFIETAVNLPAGQYSVTINLDRNDLNVCKIKNVMIVKGTIPRDYIPYNGAILHEEYMQSNIQPKFDEIFNRFNSLISFAEADTTITQGTNIKITATKNILVQTGNLLGVYLDLSLQLRLLPSIPIVAIPSKYKVIDTTNLFAKFVLWEVGVSGFVSSTSTVTVNIRNNVLYIDKEASYSGRNNECYISVVLPLESTSANA